MDQAKKMTTEIPGSHSLFMDNRIPLYVQCSNLMRQRIAQDVWPVGEKIPTIEVLMAELEVSRITVRAAIKLLTDEGLVIAKRGFGTLVRRKPDQMRPLNLSSNFRNLVEIYSEDVPFLRNMKETSDLPKLNEGEGILCDKYVNIRRVHLREDIKYCVISFYIDDRLFQQVPDRFRTELALPILASLPSFQFSRGWQTLRISKSDLETAKLLGIPIGEPTAEVRRILLSEEGKVIYLADITYRGDYISLQMDLHQ